MPNHVHLIIETSSKGDLSVFMKSLNLAYFNYYKKKYGYAGHFWQDRFKSIIIEKNRYLLACGVYIENNPVKAKIVNSPGKYPYSSYAFYVQHEKNKILVKDPIFYLLGKNDEERIKQYREYFKKEEAFNFNLHKLIIGSDKFKKDLKNEFNIKEKLKRGRPKTKYSRKDQILDFMKLSNEDKLAILLAFKKFKNKTKNISRGKYL
jgi:putative transposase